jgi:hypothetical protein
VDQVQQDAFIAKCVRKNAILPTQGRVGINQAYTVQELLILQDNQLRHIGKGIESLIKAHGGSKFEKKSQLEIPDNSGILASEWEDFIAAVLDERDKARAVREKAARITALEKELEGYKTPGQKKKELEAELASLKG